MDHTTRNVLIAAFLGSSVIAIGGVGQGGMSGTTTTDAGAADAQSYAVPYFPAQYTLDAPTGTSDQLSTF